jgi:NADH-quinone oxidoreductase subunit D
MPIVVAAIDPCFSCTDRMISIEHLDSKKREVMDWDSLRSYSIAWHKGHGVDFGKLNRELKERMK